jgi:hypothetical protein
LPRPGHRWRNPTRTWRTNNGGTTQAAIDCTHKVHATNHAVFGAVDNPWPHTGLHMRNDG